MSFSAWVSTTNQVDAAQGLQVCARLPVQPVLFGDSHTCSLSKRITMASLWECSLHAVLPCKPLNGQFIPVNVASPHKTASRSAPHVAVQVPMDTFRESMKDAKATFLPLGPLPNTTIEDYRASIGAPPGHPVPQTHRFELSHAPNKVQTHLQVFWPCGLGFGRVGHAMPVSSHSSRGYQLLPSRCLLPPFASAGVSTPAVRFKIAGWGVWRLHATGRLFTLILTDWVWVLRSSRGCHSMSFPLLLQASKTPCSVRYCNGTAL